MMTAFMNVATLILHVNFDTFDALSEGKSMFEQWSKKILSSLNLAWYKKCTKVLPI